MAHQRPPECVSRDRDGQGQRQDGYDEDDLVVLVGRHMDDVRQRERQSAAEEQRDHAEGDENEEGRVECPQRLVRPDRGVLGDQFGGGPAESQLEQFQVDDRSAGHDPQAIGGLAQVVQENGREYQRREGGQALRRVVHEDVAAEAHRKGAGRGRFPRDLVGLSGPVGVVAAGSRWGRHAGVSVFTTAMRMTDHPTCFAPESGRTPSRRAVIW